MKKFYLYAGVLAAGMLAFSACSNDDDPISGGVQETPEVAAGEQVIVLDVQNTDVLATKSRPLYSTENKGSEDVTDVQLFVFKLDAAGQRELVNILDINDWNLAVPYDYGHKYTLKLTGTNKLEKGNTYTIVAVGQDQDNKTVAPLTVSAGTNKFPNLVLADFTNKIWNPNTTAGDNFLFTDAVS